MEATIVNLLKQDLMRVVVSYEIKMLCLIISLQLSNPLQMNNVRRKPVFEVCDQVLYDSNRLAQLQKLARALTFYI